MSPKRLNKKTTTTPTISDETKDRNKYADSFIKDLRKLKSGEIPEVNIDYTKIKIKQSIKLIKLNIDDKKLVLTTDEGGEYFLNDRTINQIMTKKMDSDLSSTDQGDYEYDETEDLQTAKSAKLRVITSDTKTKPGGVFFKYTHNTIFDLTRYHIFKNDDVFDYNNNCLYIALNNAGLKEDKLEMLKQICNKSYCSKM